MEDFARQSLSRSRLGLSARLLVLTVAFIMLAELLIYAPSIARFRKNYLEQALAVAELAAMSLDAAPGHMVSSELERRLLFYADAHAVVVVRPERRVLVLEGDAPPEADLIVDFRKEQFWGWIADAFAALGRDDNRTLRVIGWSAKARHTVVETNLDERPMRQAMHEYSVRILDLSVMISLLTAGVLYLSLHLLLVRPMRRITASMMSFREDPEDERRVVVPGPRRDEIGTAERELARLQQDVRTALRQRGRLAALGAAVAKINHDLRNSLAIAALASDALTQVDDPTVKKVVPRLYDAIDRAVNLCGQTLDYAASGEIRLRSVRFPLRDLVAKAGFSVSARDESGPPFNWDNQVPEDLELTGDPDQLYRVLVNLGLNARQAMAGRVSVSARSETEQVIIEIADTGPGFPRKAMDRLFQPFAGSARTGGSGLGLVIARDIVRAHGGTIELAKSDATGATLRIALPTRR